jgi:integrase
VKVSGEGTIERRGKGTYRVRHNLGRNAVTKKYQYSPWRTIKGNKTDARKALEEYRREIEGGLRLDADKMTFAELADMFHSERVNAGVIGKQTAMKDFYVVRALKRYLGDVPISDINAAAIAAVYGRMVSEDNKSASVVHAAHIKLKQIMKFAVDRDYLLRNPIDKVTAPKAPESSRKSLTVEELGRFVTLLSERTLDGYTMTVRIALSTGMRRSEILGLTWNRIDLAEHSIDVKQTLTEGRQLRQGTKTKKSTRRIPIDGDTVSIIKSWKIQQAESLLKLGIKQNGDTPVTSNRAGDFLDHHNFGRWWRWFCVRGGFGEYRDDDGNLVPPPRYNDQGQQVDENGRCYSRSNKMPKQPKRHYSGLRLHELRHTYASQLIANGVDFRTCQELLGHASASTTLNLYAHAQDEQKRAASDLMGNLLKRPANVSEKIVSL